MKKRRTRQVAILLACLIALTSCGGKTVAEEKQEEKPEIKLEEKQEQKVEQKVEEKQEQKVENKQEQKAENKQEQKTEVKTEEKMEAPVAPRVEEKPELEPKEKQDAKITSHFVSKTALNKTASYVYNKTVNPNVGSIGGEWAVIGLKQSGYTVPSDYFDKYYEVLSSNVQERQGVLHAKKYTEYSRTVLCLSLIGYDATNVEGYNLLEPLNDFNQTAWQGNNGTVWALIAIDSNNLECTQRQAYVNAIVSAQLSSGAWSIAGTTEDIDMTGMAIAALSNYASQKNVKAAIQKGFEYIENAYSNNAIVSSEGYAQCLVAYSACNRSLPEGMFDAFVAYELSDGSFEHTHGGGANQMASEQALYALTALFRAENGMKKVFKV